MARIAGVNIPTNKRVVIALQYIHGIGQAKAREIVTKVGIEDARRVNQLTDAEVAAYDAPFPDETYKEGARQFPTLVPVTPEHASVAENLAAWKVLEAFDKAVAQGSASTTVDGRMIDEAMAKAARRVLDQAEAWKKAG